jgi:ABC-2 type transport system permease protein
MPADVSSRPGPSAPPAPQGVTQRVPGVPVLRATLRRERRSTLVWMLAMGAMSALYWGLWPTIRDDPAIAELKAQSLGRVGDAMGFSDLSTSAKYLDATVFGLLGPLLLIIFAVIAGSRAVAGDDEQGLLDLYLAQPVSRARYLVERMGALVVQVGLLAGTVALVVVALDVVQDSGLATGDLVTGAAGLGLVGLTFGLVAVVMGAVVGRRGPAVGVAAGAALLTYLAYGFSSQISALADLRYLSPFWWFGGHAPASGGLTLTALAVLVAVPVVLAAVAVPAFDRRDVGV